MIRHIVHEMIAKTTILANSQSAALNVSEFSGGLLYLDVGAVKAGATLDITIQSSPDGTNWHQLDTMTQVTDAHASTQRPVKALTEMGLYIRASYVLAGVADPSVNFGLKFVGKGEY